MPSDRGGDSTSGWPRYYLLRTVGYSQCRRHPFPACLLSIPSRRTGITVGEGGDMRKGALWFVIGVMGTLVLATLSRDAEAIPAFARKYKTACITCHATFPRLTALGEAFRLNGYRMPGGDELYVKDTPMSLGAAAYKQVFPNAVWPSDIPGMPPLALRVAVNYTGNTGGGVTPKTDFIIDEATLLGLGSLGENMSFFVAIEHHDASLTSTFNPADNTISNNFDSG